MFSKDKCVLLNDTINSDAGEAHTCNSLFSSQALYHSADLILHQNLSRKYKCRLFLMKYMFKGREKKQRCPRRMQNGENHIHNCHFERYIVRYVCKSSFMTPLARRRKFD